MKSDVVINKRNGKSKGVAIVFFKSQEQAEEVQQTYNRRYIAGRYIQIRKCEKSDIIS